MRSVFATSFVVLALSACTSLPSVNNYAEAQGSTLCATPEQTKIVHEYLQERPGVPLAIPSRKFEIPEATVSSALSSNDAVGVIATPEIASKIWDSIEAWGATSEVGLVFSPSGQHAFALPSLVPMRVDADDDGYLDVYADDGKGVHSHIQIKYVDEIYAVNLKAENGDLTSGVTYFGPDGHAILGIFASIKGQVYSESAMDGFEKTWNLISTMPEPCE